MSRGRGPRGRERDTTSDQSQRILQAVLIGAGVLFLLIGALIAAGVSLPGTGALSDTGDDSGSASTPIEEQTPTPTATSTASETVPDTTTQQPTTQTTTQQPTTQTTQTDTPTPTQTTTEATRTAASGGVSIVDTTDKNGNGYVSDFDLEISADTRLENTDSMKDGSPYFIVKINGNEVGQTDELKQTENGIFTIDLKPSMLQQYQQGQLQVTVELMAENDGQNEQVDSWTQTVDYEPE